MFFGAVVLEKGKGRFVFSSLRERVWKREGSGPLERKHFFFLKKDPSVLLFCQNPAKKHKC